MSRKEAERMKVISQLEKGFVKQKDAAVKLNLTVRQVRRLQKRYQGIGAFGLISCRRGAPSSNRLSEEIKNFCLIKIYAVVAVR